MQSKESCRVLYNMTWQWAGFKEHKLAQSGDKVKLLGATSEATLRRAGRESKLLK